MRSNTRSGRRSVPTSKASEATASMTSRVRKKTAQKPSRKPSKPPVATPKPKKTVAFDSNPLPPENSSPLPAPRPLQSTVEAPINLDSSPPPFGYILDTEVTLRIGTTKPYRESATFVLYNSIMEGIEGIFDKLKTASIQERDFKFARRSILYRPGCSKATWRHIQFEDFSFVEQSKLITAIDQYIGLLKPKRPVDYVDLKVEITIQVEALEKAFPRNRSVNEPSSDPPGEAVPTPRNSRTNQIIREQRATERAQEIAESMEHHYLL